MFGNRRPRVGRADTGDKAMSKFGHSTRMFTWRSLAPVAALAIAVAAPSAASAQSAPHQAHNDKNIVEVATAAGSFSTLLAAVKAAGLVETLQGEGPFTVFAPSDAAFAKVPKATLDALLADKAALKSVLTFHVVSGRVVAGDIVKANGAMPKTVNGQPLDIKVRDGKVYVNGAQVVTADVQASNGVIHIIDSVLLPASAPGGR
jgi:uncharacterized surface protein with fasciclin (FAS1) repeats